MKVKDKSRTTCRGCRGEPNRILPLTQNSNNFMRNLVSWLKNWNAWHFHRNRHSRIAQCPQRPTWITPHTELTHVSVFSHLPITSSSGRRWKTIYFAWSHGRRSSVSVCVCVRCVWHINTDVPAHCVILCLPHRYACATLGTNVESDGDVDDANDNVGIFVALCFQLTEGRLIELNVIVSPASSTYYGCIHAQLHTGTDVWRAGDRTPATIHCSNDRRWYGNHWHSDTTNLFCFCAIYGPKINKFVYHQLCACVCGVCRVRRRHQWCALRNLRRACGVWDFHFPGGFFCGWGWVEWIFDCIDGGIRKFPQRESSSEWMDFPEMYF